MERLNCKNIEMVVKFTKVGGKIMFTLPVRMFCNRMSREIENYGTFDIDDRLFTAWLGNDIEAQFKYNNVIYRKVDITQMYDDCDVEL